MTRKEFLKHVGIGAAFVLTVPCLHSCKDDDEEGGGTLNAGDKDFTVDLSDQAIITDFANQGYIIRNSVVIAQPSPGVFAAASQICSHEGTNAVVFDSSEWFCLTHGARFATATGTPANSVTDRSLRIYQTTYDATAETLRVFS